MASKGDDCYFYYYSTCAKGDDCPFRHQPAAFANERTCEQWAKGVCIRDVCQFRHMIIEKNRAQIPCFFESQLTGCLKPFCPFLHTRPRPVDPAPISNPPNIPAPATKGESNAAVTDPNVLPASQEPMRIPTVLSQPRLRPHQGGSIPTPPILPPYPAVGTRPMLEVPRVVARAPQFTGPPRPGGMEQPDSVMGGVPPGLAGVHLRYTGTTAPQQPYPPFYPGRPAGSSLPYLAASKVHKDDSAYSKEDTDSFSSSGSEEEKRRLHPRRRVHNNSRREVTTSNKREIRNRRQQSNKHLNERDRTSERKRPNRTRDRTKTLAESEYERSKMKKNFGKSRKPAKEEGRDKNNLQGKETVDAKDKDTTGEGKSEEKDPTSPGLNIKTLEEILREKALKKLEERRAQNKLSMDKEKETSRSKVEEDSKETVQLNEAKVEPQASDVKSPENVESEARVSRSPLKLITARTTGVNNKNVAEISAKEPPSPFQQVKVKSFDEIMQEKRKRKEQSELTKAESQASSSKDRQLTDPPTGQADSQIPTSSNPPKRIKRLVRRSSSGNEGEAKVVSSSESKVQPSKTRTVYVMEKPSPTKTSKESGVAAITASKEENKQLQTSPQKVAVAERLGVKRLKVKSFEEIMEEKRQRKSQRKVECQDSESANEQKTTGLNAQVNKDKIVQPPKAAIIRPRRIKVWARTNTKERTNEDIVSSSVTDSPPQERDSQAISSPTGNTDKGLQKVDHLKTADLKVEPVSTECSLYAIADIPNSAGCNRSSVVKENEVENTSEVQSILSEETSDSPDVTSNTQERQVDVDTSQVSENYFKETTDALGSSKGLCSDSTALKDFSEPTRQQEANFPPSYEEIKQAIINEMSKKDDFFGDAFEGSIDLGEDDDVDAHELNEDDLLMELDEMINQ